MPADRILRKARDRFSSPKTQLTIKTEVLKVSGVTVFDVERIVTQLGERLDDFKNIEGFKRFRVEVVAWGVRQAQLTATLRELLQQQPNAYDATLLFTVLPSYDGEVSTDALQAWAETVMQRKADAIAAIPAWVEEYRNIIYAGIWDELNKCLDLGVGGYAPVTRAKKRKRLDDKELTESDYDFSGLYHPVVEELASDVWLWVCHNAYDLIASPVPIHCRLKAKANMAAFLWKLGRLDNRRDFISMTTLDERRKKIEKLIETEDKSFLSTLESNLVRRSEDADLDDVRELERVLYDAELDRQVDAEIGEGEAQEELPLAA